jgi:hypothetical protein
MVNTYKWALLTLVLMITLPNFTSGISSKSCLLVASGKVITMGNTSNSYFDQCVPIALAQIQWSLDGNGKYCGRA